MDKRLMEVVVCPACHGELRYSSESDSRRLISGEFGCAGCGLVFPVVDEIPVLVVPGTDMDGAFRKEDEDIEKQMAEWVRRNFDAVRRRELSLVEQDFVNAVRTVEGPVVDIASGPGGSYCVPMMEHGGSDGLFVMSDLGEPVMHAWREHLREVGWADRCSLMVFDARRMPFRSESIPVVTSAVGLENIPMNRPAYEEIARVLRPGGRLLQVIKLYEEGGASQRAMRELGDAATGTWCGYEGLLRDLGLTIERWEPVWAGCGKSDPTDLLPQDDEAWEIRMVYAVRS